MINNPNKIFIHCSDSPQGRGDGAKEIHSWHKQRGWDGIGYNYVILEDGIIENGRPDYWTPAHAKGHNENSLAICLIGKTDFTENQFQSLAFLIDKKMRQYNIKKEDIKGHYEVSSKTCPNFDVKEFVEKWFK